MYMLKVQHICLKTLFRYFRLTYKKLNCFFYLAHVLFIFKLTNKFNRKVLIISNRLFYNFRFLMKTKDLTKLIFNVIFQKL